MRLLVLGVGVLPYIGLVGLDLWLHEKSRRVPRMEMILHASMAITLGGFLTSVYLDATVMAIVCLGLSLPLMAADELGFHQALERRERLVHFGEMLALLLFIAVWATTKGWL